MLRWCRTTSRPWLDGQPLYAGDAMFHTLAGLDLPFTYPPLAAIVFSPFAWMSLPVASVTITVITLILGLLILGLLVLGLLILGLLILGGRDFHRVRAESE